MKGHVTPEDYQSDFGGYYATSVLIANTTEEMQDGRRVCEVKNSINAGETLELLTPDGHARPYTLPATLHTVDGEELPVAQNHHRILLDGALPAFAILRRVEG